jgi:ribosomal-protein-alanine N-acetyltransferase
MINDKCFENFPLIESARLNFRAYTIEDAADLNYIRSNPQVMKYMDSDYHNTLEDSIKDIERKQVLYKNKEGICWVIEEKSSGKFIGDFAFWKIDRKNHRAEIGYTLKPEYWGLGYMTETLNRLLKYGYENMNLHSIEANVNPSNENSRNLLLKLGFRKEGFYKENYFYNGQYLDSEIYGLICHEFKG